MEFILGTLLGITAGVLLTGAVFIKDINEVIKEGTNAESRAVIHFRKLFKIEYILNKSEKTKENYFETINKIKEVINDRQINK